MTEDVSPSPQVGISNTEVQSAYKCELAWLYGFHPELRYQIRSMGPARTTGILGHKVLEKFYLEIKEGSTFEAAKKVAMDWLQDQRVEVLQQGDFMDVDLLGILNFLYDILGKYFDYHKDDIENWEILEVEEFHAMEWEGEDDFYLPLRLDMVVYIKRGQFAGEICPVDHKFVYDFWKWSKFRLNSQFPVYQKALKAARYADINENVVKRTIVNEIRRRPLKNPTAEDLFKRSAFAYADERVENVFQNHLKSAVHLAWIKRLPLAEARHEVRASLGSEACTFCDFKEVCDIEFEGGDPKTTIAATLKPNEYGYPPLEEIRRERN